MIKVDAFFMMRPLLLIGVTFMRGKWRASGAPFRGRLRRPAWTLDASGLKAMQKRSREIHHAFDSPWDCSRSLSEHPVISAE
jgi:hypothetical protein